MKNSFKLGFVALVIAISAAACNGCNQQAKPEPGSKIDTLIKKDSTAIKPDTTKKDTTVKK